VILFELTNSENHPAYRQLAVSNLDRQYEFLRSIVVASLEMERPFLSQSILKALNYHAITCLHTHAGEYRPCEVHVGNHEPPRHFRVNVLMDDFVNTVNREWESLDPITLSTYVLWKINYIHPFINGNGRTARAASYFVLCMKLEGWLPGHMILPELLRQHREEYVDALQAVDKSLKKGQLDLAPLEVVVSRLLDEQLQKSESE